MDEAIFYEVVVPLLANVGTALICISTLVDSYNFFTDMCMARREDGTHVFEVVAVEGICANCKKMPLVEQKLRCTHMEKNMPMWKNKARLDMIKSTFYKDKPTLLSRETLGVLTEAKNKAFPSTVLDAFEQRQTVREVGSAGKCLFMTLDPNMFGGSHVSITTVYLSNGKIVIVGLDAYPVSTQDGLDQFLFAHISALRDITRFADSNILFIPESNLATSACGLANAVRNCPDPKIRNRFHPVYLDHLRPTIPGALTHMQKDAYVESLLMDLSIGSACFDEEMISANPILQSQDAIKKYKDGIKGELMKQLRRFRVIVDSTAWRNTKPKYTGKVDEEGNPRAGLNDDMVISLMMASYWSKRIMIKNRQYNIDDALINKNFASIM